MYWVSGSLPPSVFVGKMVSFYGKLVTYNEGRLFRVVEAVPLTEKFWKIADPLYRYLWHFAEDPRDWVEEGLLDKIRVGSL